MGSRQQPTEPIIDPDLPIVDPHHHLHVLTEAALSNMAGTDSVMVQLLQPVFRSRSRYLLDELMTDLTSGHNVCATVFAESHAMYRASGPEAFKSLGEVEFANGVAAMAASGTFGEVKACAGIVGYVDLALGDAVEDVLRAHLQAGGGRYRGVRQTTVYDADSSIFGGGGVPQVLLDKQFRVGFKWLHQLGLSFDATVLEPQLPEVIDLARTFLQTQVVLTHCGMPLGIGRYAGRREERFPIWRDQIRKLAACENVAVKLGGLGMPLGGFKSFLATPRFTSEQLAEEWRPYVETCIEAFGAERCMFESNFPVDAGACSYPVLWNAFKRLVTGASSSEKTALFSGTAVRVYRLNI